MQTNFTLAQLEDPELQLTEQALRACVHCGFCIATCPTYVLLGDELDSPRGRIYLIKDMLERDTAPGPEVVRHLDRCLACLACVTACPSGVDYRHVIDHGRRYVEDTARRPIAERLKRKFLALVLPSPVRFLIALNLARLARPFRRYLPAAMRRLVAAAPARVPVLIPPLSPTSARRIGPRIRARIIPEARIFPAEGHQLWRVALVSGCVQRLLAPTINSATIRLLTRHGCEVVVPRAAGCCGAVAQHLGRREDAEAAVRGNIKAYMDEINGRGLDAILHNASGCGTMMKDYGAILAHDRDWARPAKRISELTGDISTFLVGLGLIASFGRIKEMGVATPEGVQDLRVAYHSPCSMHHGQKVSEQPMALLRAAGFDVFDAPENGMCCGAAGTYGLLQPELSTRLGDRKARNIESVDPAVIATGNMGCGIQISAATEVPVVHTVELLDWATGGPKPPGMGVR